MASRLRWVLWAVFGLVTAVVVFGAVRSRVGHPFDTLGTPEGNAAARQHVLAQGRQVAALVGAGDAAALFARLTPDMAHAVPEGQMGSLLAQVRARGGLGTPTGESVRVMGGDGHVYVGDYGPPGHGIHLSVVFLPSDKIQGLLIRPR